MYFENRTVEDKDIRQFGLATSSHLMGPWKLVANDHVSGGMLRWSPRGKPWTEEISHGEMLRTGVGQTLEYDTNNRQFLIQELLEEAHHDEYVSLGWRLGIITNSTKGEENEL